MAELALDYPTLGDLQKQLGPDNKLARQMNIMRKKNDFLKFLPFRKGNLPTGELATVLTGLPTGAWRKLNGGTIPSTDAHSQIIESCGMLESIQVCDKKLAKLSGNEAEYRFRKGKSHMETLTQEAASTFWYADKSTPEKPLGLAARFNDLVAAENKDNIIDAAGTGSDNASIWLLGLGEESLSGIFPSTSETGGLSHSSDDDFKVQNANGVTGAIMEAYYDKWMWDFGLALYDWRYVVRIANIDISNLEAFSSNANLAELLMRAESLMPDDFASSTQPILCMNRQVYKMLRIQLRRDVSSGGGLTYENIEGKRIAYWDEIPIVKTDSLLSTEARVV